MASRRGDRQKVVSFNVPSNMETTSLTTSSSPLNSSNSSSSASYSNSSSSEDQIIHHHHIHSRGPWTRKPLSVVLEEQEKEEHDHISKAERHLTLIDLISIGVGGTIGSGIFVLTGVIAHHYAGPATALSFAVSGVAACCSGICYAELAGRIPAAGSTYVYAYVSLGEWAAVIAGACLTLEYALSGAAVARSWGDKVVEWLTVQWEWENAAYYLGGDYFNPMAGFVSAISVVLLSYGVKESKNVTNFFTFLKLALVVFMAIGGLLLLRTDNLVPMIPYGTAGVMRGATASFFGYLGYDEVCCVASEAKNPKRDMPRAVLWTLAIVTISYIVASLALTGMMPYNEISDISGFPEAFQSRGIIWASQLSAAGEVLTLPVVVVISLMAQPRLFQAMAQDGLLPDIFTRLDQYGNLKWGVVLSGVPMTIIATLVPFAYLDDFISVGILLSFNMTDTSLILMRCRSPLHKPNFLCNSLTMFHVLACALGLSCHWDAEWLWHVRYIIFFTLIIIAIWMRVQCPPTKNFFGGALAGQYDGENGDSVFETPLLPILPCCGILINWYLIAQLEWGGILLLFVYVGLVTFAYMTCCRNSPVRWATGSDISHSIFDEEDAMYNRRILLREFSMPKR